MFKTNKITFRIDGRVLFKDLDVSLDSKMGKKVALVGENGCGKSSLLRIFVNEIKPTEGSIAVGNEVIGYLPQNIELSEDSLVGDFLASKLEEEWMEYKIEKVLRDVGLGSGYILKNLSFLSGGEKVKVALAGLFNKSIPHPLAVGSPG